MFFKKDLGRKFFKFFMCFVLCLIPVLILSSCSSSQQIRYWEENGKSKAFSHDEDTNVVLYLADGQIDYYINIDSINNSDYYEIACKAIDEANRFTNISIRNVSNSNCANTISISDLGGNDVNAYNTFIYNRDNGKISQSNIIYNSYYMNAYSIKTKTHIAIHEMGHTLGLADLEDDTIKDYSIMYYAAGYGSEFQHYQEYDIANITWFYGGEYQ